jgi:oligopeptide/dipeptide ABC transporter ATP-binding protein
MGMLFITHDLGVVAEIADRVAVMYAGRIVEQAAVADLFARPRHPYTQALLRSLPRIERTAKPERAPLEAIAGQVPTPLALPPGCAFAPRCALATDVCQAARPPLERTPDGQDVRCFRWREAA